MAITQVIGFTEPYVGTQQFYVGVTFSRTATGSGTSSETATRSISPVRTATGAGSSSFDATGLITHVRQGASSAGTGGSASSGYSTVYSQATGFGVGSGTADFYTLQLRDATGSGAGSSSASGYKTVYRTVESSGSGSSSSVGIRVVEVVATGSGQGSTSGSAVGYKFHMFRPPTRNDVPTQLVGGDRIANRLARFYAPGLRGVNVYKLTDLSFTEVDQHDYTVVEKVYHGGHVHTLTEEEYTDLLAAGYSEYLT